MATALAFHNHQFNVVNRNSQIWFTSSDLAAALQYKNEKSITNLFNKNSDEFTAGMSEVIESVTTRNPEPFNLSVSGNLRVKVRIFSLRGAHLIAMFARTPVAKEFRRWVLDILDREAGLPSEEPAKIKARQCTAKQLTPLRQVVERLITTGVGQIYPDIWKLVHQRFDVDHIHQLQPGQVGEAIEYLNVLEGEYLEREMLPEISPVQLTNEELCALCWVWRAAEYMRENIERIYPALRDLNSDYAPTFYSMAFEHKHTLEVGRKILDRETRSITPQMSGVSGANWRRVLPWLRKAIYK